MRNALAALALLASPALAQAPASAQVPVAGDATPASGPIGACAFDPATLAFAGTPVVQAECLLQKIAWRGIRSPQPLPAVLRRVLEQGGAPPPGALQIALDRFPEPYRTFAAANAALPVSRTEAGLAAHYFVIHDTSTPFLGERPFPRDLDRDTEVNSFDPYFAAEPVAHIFLNRGGQVWAGHDFVEPWRATKLESRVVGIPARGRFLHIETIQPRRLAAGSQWRGDTIGPQPGFSKAQYQMLAALYVYASARAGEWLIPGFHNGVDAEIPQAHDDPQNFELKHFGSELEKLLEETRHSAA